MVKTVGIILVNYQNYAIKFLSACRDSLRAQDYPATAIKVYIVDNAASEQSTSYLQQTYPEAQVLPRPDGNYAAANNLGFNQAFQDGCDYVVTVNMDTETDQQWLSELVRALDLNPQAGLAQSKILLYPKTDLERARPRLNTLGNIIHFLGFGFTSHYGEQDKALTGYPIISGYASGCSFIVRREAWEKIGGYNEEFYMYHDDIELSLKTRLAGYQIILAPLSIIYHKYEFARSINMLYYMERNRYLLILCFYPGYLLLLISLPLLIMDLGMAAYSFLAGWSKTERQVYQYFFRPATYKLVSQERRRIKQLSTIKFSQLARNFSGRIEFQEVNNPILQHLVNPVFNWYWQLVKKIV
jgi:GT2 family glycosyltransferase